MTLRTPEFLQTKTYSAMRDRLAFQHGGSVQAGTWDMGDFVVTQRASSANMSVDVAAGYALVSANDPGNAGLYHVQNDASVNVATLVGGGAWPVGHATLPRIDSVYLIVNDTTDGGDASDTPNIAVVQGTATAGATLDNRTGAGTAPTGALLLADVLMPAASTTVTTANIRDRRTSARLGWFKIASGYAATTAISFNNLTLWGGVDHLRVVGRARSLRATAQTGLRFTVNGLTSGYAIIAAVDNGTPAAPTTSQSWGYIGQIAAANSADLGAFELDLIYANTLDNAPLKHYHTACVSYISSGTLLSNQRAAGIIPLAMKTARVTSVAVMDDASSNLDSTSFAELWVFGG